MNKIFILCAFFSFVSHAEVIRINGGRSSEDSRHFYTRRLVHLILSVTEKKYGHVKIKEIYNEDPQKTKKDFFDGKLDMISFPYQVNHFPKGINYIPFPIRMGLLGYRVLLLKKGDAGKFESIKNLKGLQKYKMSFYPSWEDFYVYEQNKLPLYSAKGYFDVFKSVIEGRSDYTSRSIIEVTKELKYLHSKKFELDIDPHILLHYPFADFFYIKKSNKLLYDRFVTGFKSIIKDGSWIKLLKEYYLNELNALNLKKRKLIELNNPIFGPNHLENLYFWIDHEQLLKEVGQGHLNEKDDI